MEIAVPRSVAGSVLLLLALSLPLYLVHLGQTGLSDPDEPYYAVPAHEMMDTGTYAVPLFHGRPWFDKPILFYWIVLAGFLLFGQERSGPHIRGRRDGDDRIGVECFDHSFARYRNRSGPVNGRE